MVTLCYFITNNTISPFQVPIHDFPNKIFMHGMGYVDMTGGLGDQRDWTVIACGGNQVGSFGDN